MNEKLGELFSFIGGGTPDKKINEYWNGDIKWASVKDIKDKHLIDTQDRITKVGLDNSSSQLANPNELILITRIYPGKVAITKDFIAINQDLKIVRPKKEISLTYCYYIFSALENIFVKKSSGTTVLGIRLNEINEIEIPVPPLPEQHRIVQKIEELFSELDHAITTLKTTQQQLQTYRQSVLKYAFEGHFTGGMKDWKETELGNLSEYITSGSRGWAKYYSEDGDIFLRITNLDFDSLALDLAPNRIQYVRLDGVTEGIRTKVQEGDILISITGYLGMTAIVPSNIPTAFVNQHICLVRLMNQYFPKFIAYFVSSNSGGHRQFNIAGKGATKAGLSLQDIKNLRIPMPGINVQKKVVAEIETRLSESDYLLQTINQQLTHAESLRQSILQRAFSGEL